MIATPKNNPFEMAASALPNLQTFAQYLSPLPLRGDVITKMPGQTGPNRVSEFHNKGVADTVYHFQRIAKRIGESSVLNSAPDLRGHNAIDVKQIDGQSIPQPQCFAGTFRRHMLGMGFNPTRHYMGMALHTNPDNGPSILASQNLSTVAMIPSHKTGQMTFAALGVITTREELAYILGLSETQAQDLHRLAAALYARYHGLNDANNVYAYSQEDKSMVAFNKIHPDEGRLYLTAIPTISGEMLLAVASNMYRPALAFNHLMQRRQYKETQEALTKDGELQSLIQQKHKDVDWITKKMTPAQYHELMMTAYWYMGQYLEVQESTMAA